jgi:hypothetical protein
LERDISIAISAKDNFTQAITIMRNANQAFNKDLDGLTSKPNELNSNILSSAVAGAAIGNMNNKISVIILILWIVSLISWDWSGTAADVLKTIALILFSLAVGISIASLLIRGK